MSPFSTKKLAPKVTRNNLQTRLSKPPKSGYFNVTNFKCTLEEKKQQNIWNFTQHDTKLINMPKIRTFGVSRFCFLSRTEARKLLLWLENCCPRRSFHEARWVNIGRKMARSEKCAAPACGWFCWKIDKNSHAGCTHSVGGGVSFPMDVRRGLTPGFRVVVLKFEWNIVKKIEW